MAFFTKVETKDVGEARQRGGHDFEVEVVPLVLPNGNTVWDKRAVVKENTGEYLGTVGNGWEPVQPRTIYDLAETLLKETGGSITATLNMHRGAVLGIAMNLGTREFLKGDAYQLNFLLMTSFNMKYTILGKAMTNRWFCTNQLATSDHLFSIKHTRFVGDRLNTAFNMLSHYNEEIESFELKMERLLAIPVRPEEAVKWFGDLLGEPNVESYFAKIDSGFSQGSHSRSWTRWDNAVQDYRNLLYNGKGANWPGAKGTAYAALNAVTEYTNHVKSTRVHEGREKDEVKFESLTFGSSNDLNQKAFNDLLLRF